MRISRRRFFGAGLAGAVAVLAGTGAATSRRYPAPRVGNPFTLGVASGDPAPDSVVLWTRLAPLPLEPGGGMPEGPVTVDYELAHDEQFTRLVHRGSVTATRELAHSVHPEVFGLEPNRVYHYRFRAGDAVSAVGRTRTTPRPGQRTERLDFAFASCQAWHDGHYTAYGHLAEEDLDLVVHLGDYIYEYSAARNARGVAVPAPLHGEPFGLAAYRMQYALYKSDPLLQLAHARFPWLVTLDDHEVEDNWAGDSSVFDLEIDQVPAVFRQRRAAALQAMYEHQPLRAAQLPAGPAMRLHRRMAFGALAEFTLLDTRQYRDDQVCGDEHTAHCPDRFRADRSILGAPQRDWLLSGLATAQARWQILGNQVPMGETDADPGPGRSVSPDAWDGYVADRNTVLGRAADAGVRNLVVITGDRHENYAADLVRDFGDPESPVVATEFVGTSISSGGDGYDCGAPGAARLAANPHLRFFNSQRGYVRCTVTERLWRTDFRVVPYVSRPGAPVRTRASYVIADGALLS